MRSPATLGIRHLRARPGRAGLMVASVVLGVGVYFAVTIAATSTVRALDDSSGAVDGADVIAIGLGTPSLGSDDLDVVRSLDQVTGVTPVGEGRASVRLDDGVDPGSWIDLHQPAKGDVAFLTAAEARREAGDDFRPVETSLPANSLLALLVGGYLIYLTFTTATLERLHEYGTLRAIGARRSAVLRLVVVEATIVGAVGTVLGLGLGALLASTVTDLVADIAGVNPAELVLEPSTVAGATLLGVLAPASAALLPARRAARIDPVEALRGDIPDREHRSRLWIVGVACLVFGVAVVVIGRTNDTVFEASRRGLAPLLMVGAILVVPRLIPMASAALLPVASRLVPGVGSVAIQHLALEWRRSAYTAALAMIAVGSVVGFAIVDASWRPAVDDQIDRQFGADLVVAGTDDADLEPYQAGVAMIDGVEAVTVQGRGRTQIVTPGRLLVPVLAIDPATHFSVSGFIWESDGATDDAVASALAAGGVALPELEREEATVPVGGSLTIVTPSGERDATLAASYLTFGGGDARPLVMGFSTARADGLLVSTDLLLRLGPDAETERVVAAVGATVPAALVREVTTTDAAKDAVRERISSVYVLVTMVVVVMLIVGVLAIASTSTLSVLQRTREIGVLRAIGARTGAIRTMVVTEALALATVAIVLGLGLGAVIGWTLTEGIANDFGTTLPIRVAWAWLPAATVGAVAASTAAAIGPARRAAGIDPVEALAEE